MEQRILKTHSITKRYRVTFNGVRMTTAEIRCKLKSSPLFRSKLQECIRVEKLFLNEEKPKLAHSRHKTYQKNKLTKAAETAQLARANLLKIRAGLVPICNTVNTPSLTPSRHTINAEVFTQIFFPDKHHQPHDRLNPLPKLLLAQYVLHKQQDRTLKPYPFTFLLPTKLHGVSISILSKKIQSKLFPILKCQAQLWTTAEYFRCGYREAPGTITHVNGEILINPDNLPAVRKAFVRMFRAAEKRTINQAQATGGTINTNPAPDSVIIKFLVPSRNGWTVRCGKFYSVFNWCSYASKQDVERARNARRTWFDHHLQKKPIPAPNKEKFCYISSDLNKLSTQFYNENIRK